MRTCKIQNQNDNCCTVQSKINFYWNFVRDRFVAFAPFKDPRYAISVVIEHGGSGSKAAAPIAKKVIKKVLERHELRERIDSLLGEQV